MSSAPVRFFLFAVMSLMLLSGCASNKPQINMDEQQNFAAIKTFYVKSPLNSVNVTLENQLESAITSIMRGKGLSPVAQADADIEVAFLPTTARKQDGKSVSLGMGTGVFGRTTGISLGSIFSVPVGEQVSEYQNLQIDVIKNGSFIYSAAGSAELDASDNISVQRALSDLVRELLKPYPATNNAQ